MSDVHRFARTLFKRDLTVPPGIPKASAPVVEPARPEQWAKRALPPAAARHVFAAIESADAFAARWPLVASRLGVRSRSRIDVEGRVIGSGQVEGACKHWIGRRLKQTGARWRIDRANRMAGLCALKYSDQWQTYWSTAA